MSVKTTIIGGGVPSKLGPTTLGGRKGSEATQEASPASAGFKPTAMPGVSPGSVASNGGARATPSNNKPTSLSPSAIKAVERVEVSASVLPGVVRKTVEVGLAELAARYPLAQPDELQRIRAILAGVSPDTWDSVTWLNYGMEIQEDVSRLVKDRLALNDATDLRTAPRHLAQLHTLLMEVLEGLTGGVLRRPGKQGWVKHEAEIRQLASLLEGSLRGLMDAMAKSNALAVESAAELTRTAAFVGAAEFLMDRIPADKAQLLLSRQVALMTTRTLLQEHLLSLKQDESRVKELVVLIQDGVMLKLPAVYTQLASLPDQFNDTQRHLVVDKLDDLLKTI